ncbi:MAG: Fe-S cluster assembly ATPase SufC [Myxococcaceae bacterium]|nr:Fe-S cluster assembly ATPase SufC [Myxococcaceae bacterium]MBH2006169.1 Fe-S cluster assembly ATPase SufC [Myxococcaceae bacterium]
MLKIQGLNVRTGDKPILKGLSLEIKSGEVHAIMGPNGSGKSTLSQVLAGHSAYTIESGSVSFKNQDLFLLSPEQRALEGLFLAFQYPIEIPGVNNTYFLKAAMNAKRRHLGLPEMDAVDFLKKIQEKMALLKMDKAFLERNVNEGFSGGEKKRNEALQIALLEPDLAILDETDSGLDIDALRIVAANINALRHANRSFLLVTHYQRLLDYIVPDYVHVLRDGAIVQTGPKELALSLEQTGYDSTH